MFCYQNREIILSPEWKSNPQPSRLQSHGVPLRHDVPQVYIFIYSNKNNFISEWQNYLRTQAGNTTTVNVVICTVDYLLRLQESIMDFYWHYSSKVS